MYPLPDNGDGIFSEEQDQKLSTSGHVSFVPYDNGSGDGIPRWEGILELGSNDRPNSRPGVRLPATRNVSQVGERLADFFLCFMTKPDHTSENYQPKYGSDFRVYIEPEFDIQARAAANATTALRNGVAQVGNNLETAANNIDQIITGSIDSNTLQNLAHCCPSRRCNRRYWGLMLGMMLPHMPPPMHFAAEFERNNHSQK